MPFDESSTPPTSAFGAYRVLHSIGSGVLGPVYRTYDTRHDRLVAVKAFRLDLTPDRVAGLADGLRRLASAPALHPNAVAFVDAGLEGTSPYLAMEYQTGEPLDTVLRQIAPAPIDRSLAILTPLAAVIDAGAVVGVGHGALHPRDVFVMDQGAVVKVTGFGVVQALESAGVPTPALRRPYTAPERASGPWDVRADIYSLAVIAHEILTRRRPAPQGEQDGQFNATLSPEARVQVRRVLAQALSEDPARRFPTAAAFLSALSAADEAVPSRTTELTPVPDAPEPSLPLPALTPELEAEPEPEPEPDYGPAPEPEPQAEAVVAREELTGQIPLPLAQPATAPDPPADPAHELPLAVTAPSSDDRLAAFELPLAKPVSWGGTLFGEDVSLSPIALVDRALPPPRRPSSVGVLALTATLVCLGLGVGLGFYLWQRHATQVAESNAAARAAKVERPPAVITPERSSSTSTSTSVPAEISAPKAQTPPAAIAAPAPSTTTVPAVVRAPTPAEGRIVIHSTPSGSMVTIDGKPRGETPLAVDRVAFGSHKVLVAYPGHVPSVTEVLLSAKTPTKALTVTLTPGVDAALARNEAGALDVDSMPRGARVTVDGHLVGQSPLRVPELQPGAHTLVIEASGYRTITMSVTVAPGAARPIRVTLERE